MTTLNETMLTDFPIRFLDRDQEILILERRLPHWSQAGTLAFITWRTVDSMPEAVLQRWYAERDRWLREHGIDPRPRNWRERLQTEKPDLYREFRILFWNRWHDELDQGHGACVLRREDCAKVVLDSLQSSNRSAYIVTDFVVMPNHVHLLAAFRDGDAMVDQCESWKHFMATRINRLTGSRGRFWQQDAFDHLLRNEEQIQYLRKYIADNPNKARLRAGEFVHYSL